MPLPKKDPKEKIPKNIQTLAQYMRQHYTESGQWWTASIVPTRQTLPDELTAEESKEQLIDAEVNNE